MKILVLGSTGMAGHVVSTYLKENGHSVTKLGGKNKLDSETINLDLTDKNKFEDFLDQNEFDVIVNCVGILIELSVKRKDLSTYLNSFLPHFLEERFKDSKTKIIHLSTDCVFSGENGPYREDSKYDGDLFYDRTKALGELKNEKDLTFRMSIIGPDANPEGVGLFNWFMKQENRIFGYSNVYWNGITTIELAKAINKAITSNLTGLYHLVPDTQISKLELLKIFNNVFNKNLEIEPKESASSNKVLINTRKDFDHEITSYQEMINEMKDWVLKYKNLYPHYDLGEK